MSMTTDVGISFLLQNLLRCLEYELGFMDNFKPVFCIVKHVLKFSSATINFSSNKKLFKSFLAESNTCFFQNHFSKEVYSKKLAD